MSIIKIMLLVILVVGTGLILITSLISLNQEKIVAFECSPEFWKSNLDLWKFTGIDPNSDFDETFGRDYFDPDISLVAAIQREGVGLDHLASSGTAAYLSALIDPEVDEEAIRTAVSFGYVHQIDSYLENCKEIERKIPNLLF